MKKARYIMIGGFLGAGKTTAVSRLAEHLTAQGLRVGLITNDQGRGLVDTAMLRSMGFTTEEIPGGCFCCRFDSLVEASRNLTAASAPDVIIAEPVGSCTDLVATVTYPLRRIYGDSFTISPLSVLVDPVRARRVFGLEEGGNFSSKVVYIYRKQLEEADVIVIGKSDLVPEAQVEELRAVLEKEFPKADVRSASPRTGAGLPEWFDSVANSEQDARRFMEVDYGVYAEGEALLGWLNATVRLESSEDLDADEVLSTLAGLLQKQLEDGGAEIAHLKMTLSPDTAIGGAIGAINLVRNDHIPELSIEFDEPFRGAALIVNLRAEAEPQILADALESALRELRAGSPGLTAAVEHREFFRPGKPTPTHRDSAVV